MRNINLLFQKAKTDAAYLNELVNSLIKLGRKIANIIISKYFIYNISVEDVDDYILYLVNYILNEYKPDTQTFEQYANFVFSRRLTTKIIDMFMTFDLKISSLDDQLEDGTPLMDIIPNKNVHHIPDEISLKELELEMSSPKATDNKTNRLQRKVFKLQKAGFSNREIKEILGITEDQIRYLIKLNNKGIKEFEFKIKIK